MATDRGVTLRAQWLGQILRELREKKGVKLQEVAEYLQRNISTVSRGESGIYPIRRVDAAALLDLYGANDKQQREVWQTGWWENYLSDSTWGATIDLVWLENRAHSLRVFSPLTIPGLLQTSAYTRELFRASNPENPKSLNERSVELRMERQKVLISDKPVHLAAVVDEGVLRRAVGGSSTMRGQLAHLREMAARSNIELYVLPFSAGAQASPNGAFTLIKMGDLFPEVAHIESPGGAIYLERDDVDRLARMYDRMQESSLNADDSAVFIAALEKDLS